MLQRTVVHMPAKKHYALSDVLKESWTRFTKNWPLWISVSLLSFVPSALLSIGLRWSLNQEFVTGDFEEFMFKKEFILSPEALDLVQGVSRGDLFILAASFGFVLFLYFVLANAVQVYASVKDSVKPGTTTFSQSLSGALGLFRKMLAANILLGFILVAIPAIYAGIMYVLFADFTSAESVSASLVLIAIFAGLGMFLLLGYILVRYIYIFIVIADKKSISVVGAFKESSKLFAQNKKGLIYYLLLVWFASIVVGILISLVGSVLSSFSVELGEIVTQFMNAVLTSFGIFALYTYYRLVATKKTKK